MSRLQPRHYMFFIILGLVGILVYGGFIINDLRSEKKQLTENYNALHDTLRLHNEKYVIAALKVGDTKSVLDIKSNDSMIIQLQEAIKNSQKELERLGGAVVALKNTTEISKTLPTIIEVPIGGDPSKEYIYPTYKSKSQDAWHTMDIVANKDSTTFNLQTVGKYNVLLASEKVKGGLFPKYEPAAYVQNLSPYEKSEQMRAVIIDKTQKQKITFGGHLGFGAQYGLINKQLDIGPQGGISINFKF